MRKKRCPLLKAIEHNWGLMMPGEWSKVEWLIFPDGSYEIISFFRELEWGEKRTNGTRGKTTGQMDDAAFSKLREALLLDPWRDPSLIVHACDGVAWKIDSYREDGSIEKSSGKLDYIYGHRTLETIVGLLPSDEQLYDSSAFVRIDRNQERRSKPAFKSSGPIQQPRIKS